MKALQAGMNAMFAVPSLLFMLQFRETVASFWNDMKGEQFAPFDDLY